MQNWSGSNDLLVYPTHNENKSENGERFIKILKAKIYKRILVI